MSDRDALTDRGRALEEEYFRNKDRELVEKMRRAAAAEQARTELSRSTGVTDPEVLKELQDLGFTPDTVVLLPLVPLVQVAWAEGGVSKAEHDLIVKLARARGVTAGSAADGRLQDWLTERPSSAVFAHAGRLIRAMLESHSAQVADVSPDDLLRYCEQIAAASGGMFGIGRVSAEERALLAGITDALKGRRA